LPPNSDLGGEVGNFQTMVENWADGLAGHTSQWFDIGRYRAEVTAESGEIQRIVFDL